MYDLYLIFFIIEIIILNYDIIQYFYKTNFFKKHFF